MIGDNSDYCPSMQRERTIEVELLFIQVDGIQIDIGCPRTDHWQVSGSEGDETIVPCRERLKIIEACNHLKRAGTNIRSIDRLSTFQVVLKENGVAVVRPLGICRRVAC